MNYVLNESKMFADITDGVAIIINSETGIYYGMNSFATAIYENIAAGASSEAILKALKSLNGASENIEENFNMFINSMLEKEVILEAPANEIEVNIDEEVAKECEYAIEFKEYNDAQELLLADPIHEVKEETGWTPEKESIGYSKEETTEREKKMEEDI